MTLEAGGRGQPALWPFPSPYQNQGHFGRLTSVSVQKQPPAGALGHKDPPTYPPQTIVAPPQSPMHKHSQWGGGGP